MVALGAFEGGFSAPAPADEALDEAPEEWPACPLVALVLVAYLTVLPGKALAATSVSTPVSTTLPAIIQQLILWSSRSAASRVWVVWIRIVSVMVMVEQADPIEPWPEVGDHEHRQDSAGHERAAERKNSASATGDIAAQSL